MRSIAATVFALVVKFGGIGLLVLGILDSSYLFLPWGNDLLVVALTARHGSVAYMFYYAAMSTIGSVLGCLLLDVTLRPLGEKGLEKYLPKKRVEKLKQRIERSGGKTLAIASLAPPPFPFTVFVMAAAALQYSPRRMAAVIGATRMLRFTILGFLVLRFGTRILSWAKSPVVQVFLIVLIILYTVGSVVSVISWIRRGRSGRQIPKK